tara:strand:- start:2767 stop:3054 length:288 start_codon:yes stop_codon:yes gene_type:complete
LEEVQTGNPPGSVSSTPEIFHARWTQYHALHNPSAPSDGNFWIYAGNTCNAGDFYGPVITKVDDIYSVNTGNALSPKDSLLPSVCVNAFGPTWQY